MSAKFPRGGEQDLFSSKSICRAVVELVYQTHKRLYTDLSITAQFSGRPLLKETILESAKRTIMDVSTSLEAGHD